MSAALKSTPADVVSIYHRRLSTPTMRPAPIEELAFVELLAEAKTYDTHVVVPAGTTGTIVMVHDDGAAYDVEFTSPVGVAAVDGKDVALVRA